MSDVVEILVPANPAVIEVLVPASPVVVEVAAQAMPGPRGDDGWAAPIQKITATGPTLQINYALGKHCVITITGNVTSVSVVGWPAADLLARLTLELVNTGGFTFAPPPAKWTNGQVATNTPGAGKADTWIFTTVDGGATVKGHVVGSNYS